MTTPTGALPPSGAEWQIGKTAASIQFVKLAESYITQLHGDPAAVAELRELIDKIKSGEKVLPESSDPSPRVP